MWLLEIVTHYANTWTICLALLVLVLCSWSKLFQKHKYPPGPLPLPIIGNDYCMFPIHKARYKFEHWGNNYGSVVSFVSFGKWTVELFGFEAINEAYIKNADVFSERSYSTSPVSKVLNPGLIFGPHWKELRRQALVILRDHGMGKTAIETKIREEIEYVADTLSSLEGKQSSKDFKRVMGKAVSNIINQVVFGHRLEYDDSEIDSLSYFEAFFFTAIQSGLLPFYKYWPWDPLGLKEITYHFQQALAFFRSEIKQHKEALDVNDPKDYIDSYLVEGIKTGSPVFADEEELVSTITQLYIAGYDTTSTTLSWALLFLVNYPELQQRVYEEINQIVGSGIVSMVDRDSMHFTQAFIHETLRLGGTAGGSLVHLCTADSVIQGCKIPKGTRVLANLYSTYHDKKVFPDSYSFKPERFLDDQGNFSKSLGKQVLSFSIGKRACLGEGLARTELFMFLVSFVQRFEVIRVSETKVTEDGVDVFSHSPQPFDFILKQRG